MFLISLGLIFLGILVFVNTETVPHYILSTNNRLLYSKIVGDVRSRLLETTASAT